VVRSIPFADAERIVARCNQLRIGRQRQDIVGALTARYGVAPVEIYSALPRYSGMRLLALPIVMLQNIFTVIVVRSFLQVKKVHSLRPEPSVHPSITEIIRLIVIFQDKK
jgi:hypothetical protein